MRFTCIIGNPPYGTGANLAIKFVNKAAEHTDDLRYVLPLSFQRDSVINKIDQSLHIVHDEVLPDDTFPRSIRAVYQRFKPSVSPRGLIPVFRTHPDFTFIPYDERSKATLFIGGAGAGPAGKVKLDNFMHYAKGHHYIICSDEVRDRLVTIAPLLRTKSRQCGCLPGLGKSDIIKIYMEAYE